jgi:hypothetical protein
LTGFCKGIAHQASQKLPALGTNCPIKALKSEGVDVPSAKENLKKAEPKSERGTRTGGRFSNSGLRSPCAQRVGLSSRQGDSAMRLDPDKPAGMSRMPVTQWVAGCWIQPIDKP